MSYKQQFETLLQSLPDACRAVYGDRLVAVAVFGSVARGKMRPDSDIDLLVVARTLPFGRMARVREFDAVEDALKPCLDAAEKVGVHTCLSPIFKTHEELLRGSFLFLDMADQARILVDDEGLLASYLAHLAQRLAAQGARRIQKGGGYYWKLKPDFQWGDRIEL